VKRKFENPIDPIEYVIDHQKRSNFCLIGLPIPMKKGYIENSIENRLIGAIDRKYFSTRMLDRILYLARAGYTIGEMSEILCVSKKMIYRRIKELGEMDLIEWDE